MLPGTDDAGSWPSSTPSSTTTTASSSSSSSANGSRNEGGGELSPAHRRYTRSSHEMLLYKASDADADINGGHGSNGSNDSKGDRSSERESGSGSGSGSGGGSDDEGREAHGGAFCNGAHAPPPDTAADAEKSRQHLHHHQHQLHQQQNQQQDQQQNKAHNHTHNYQRREESLPLDTCMVTLVADSSFYVSNGENTAGAVALMMQYIEFADLKLRSTSINGGGYGVAIKKILMYVRAEDAVNKNCPTGNSILLFFSLSLSLYLFIYIYIPLSLCIHLYFSLQRMLDTLVACYFLCICMANVCSAYADRCHLMIVSLCIAFIFKLVIRYVMSINSPHPLR